MEQEQYWSKVIRTINLFKRYFADELDSEDKEMIERWDPNSSRTSSNYIPVSPNVIDEHGQKVKKRVFKQIGLQYVDEKKLEKRKSILSPYLLRYASVAAILLIVIGSTYLMLNHDLPFKNGQALVVNEKQLFAHTGKLETKKIILPDGTKVHINSNSQISYIEKEFGKDKREIWIEGEAYFDVTKNPNKPFIIHSENIKTTVRGTSFNIKAYKEIGEISVTVSTGKVEISENSSVIGMLTPNKELVYNESNKTHVISDRNWEDATAWIEKRLVLRDANIDELKIRLNQIYGMKIAIEDNILSNTVLNASYPKGAKLDSVLEGISEVYDIRYSVDETNKIVRIY